MMIRFELIECPGRTLSDESQRRLRAQILALNLRVSDQPAFVANWHARIDDFFEHLDSIDLAWVDGELVGHFGERFIELDDQRAAYVDNFIVAPEQQGRGLGRRLALRSIIRCQIAAHGGRFLHVSRTCNPHVAAGVWNTLRHPNYYYPCYDGRPSSPRLRAAAEELAASLWPDKQLDGETGVLRGAYGGEFINVQTTRHAAVAEYFDRHVDLARGDAVVQIVQYRPSTWGRMAVFYGANYLSVWARRLRSLGGAPEVRR